jgi:hypothetical protein
MCLLQGVSVEQILYVAFSVHCKAVDFTVAHIDVDRDLKVITLCMAYC